MKQLFIDVRKCLAEISDGTYSYNQTNKAPGLSDATYSGAYLNPSSLFTDKITVTIDGTGTPDTFSYINSDGKLNGAGVKIIAGNIYLGYGINIRFGATTGHTKGDSWIFDITSEAVFKFVQMWNNQLALQAENPKNTGAKIYGFPLPAAFIEFVSPNTIEQMGDGVQLYEPLMVRIHIAHEFYNDAENGDQEQDLDIFDLRELVYFAMQKFTPDGAVAFVRVNESQQYDHKNVYHYIQEYKTNYEDSTAKEPKGAVETNQGINVTFVISKLTSDINDNFEMTREDVNIGNPSDGQTIAVPVTRNFTTIDTGGPIANNFTLNILAQNSQKGDQILLYIRGDADNNGKTVTLAGNILNNLCGTPASTITTADHTMVFPLYFDGTNFCGIDNC